MSSNSERGWIVFRRTGQKGSEFAPLSHPITVVNGKATLDEIPNKFDGVTISDGTTTLATVENGLPNASTVVVDYKIGELFFDPIHEGKQFTATYVGTGFYQLSAKRVFTETTNPDAVSNIQDMIDNYNNLNGTDLYTKFDPNSGHKHSGAAGDGAKIPAINIPITDSSGVIDSFNVEDALVEHAGKLNDHTAQLADITINVKKFGAVGNGVADDTVAIQAAINYVASAEYTEAIPTQGSKGTVLIPQGHYKITGKINVPSYVHLKGAGRHATILDSYITNGDPVIDVRLPSADAQQFYVTLEGFTVNGRRQACKGVSIYRTSRWVVRDVMVDGTLHEGLNIYRSFLGEVYSPLVRACGSAGYYAVKLSGTSLVSGGSHAVSFYGGEINGGTGTEHAVFMEYGNSSGFFGTTIEGFRDGRGITVQNANAFFVHGCYFELNKEDIVEIGPTLGSSYRDNIHADLAIGARGVIGITYAQGLTLSGGYMQGGASIVKLFDATADSTGKLHMSNIEPFYSTSFPVTISPSLLESARRAGTIIEGFNGENQIIRYGEHRFNDVVEFLNELRPVGGIKNIGGFTRTNIVAGQGSPEGIVIADPSSLYLREDGARDTSIYLKTNGINNATGWLPLQAVQAGTTANRPTVTTIGYQYFDSSLGKPIFWNGTVWKDGAGTTV